MRILTVLFYGLVKYTNEGVWLWWKPAFFLCRHEESVFYDFNSFPKTNSERYSKDLIVNYIRALIPQHAYYDNVAVIIGFTKNIPKIIAYLPIYQHQIVALQILRFMSWNKFDFSIRIVLIISRIHVGTSIVDSADYQDNQYCISGLKLSAKH